MKLDKLRELLAKATNGPWAADDWTMDDGPNKTTVEAHLPEILQEGQLGIWPDGICKRSVAETSESDNSLANAALIATLRNHADALIECAEAAKKVALLESEYGDQAMISIIRGELSESLRKLEETK